MFSSPNLAFQSLQRKPDRSQMTFFYTYDPILSSDAFVAIIIGWIPSIKVAVNSLFQSWTFLDKHDAWRKTKIALQVSLAETSRRKLLLIIFFKKINYNFFQFLGWFSSIMLLQE